MKKIGVSDKKPKKFRPSAEIRRLDDRFVMLVMSDWHRWCPTSQGCRGDVGIVESLRNAISETKSWTTNNTRYHWLFSVLFGPTWVPNWTSSSHRPTTRHLIWHHRHPSRHHRTIRHHGHHRHRLDITRHHTTSPDIRDITDIIQTSGHELVSDWEGLRSE